MARSRWKMALFTAFAGAGVAWGQQSIRPMAAPASGSGRVITVQEFGGPKLQCRVLRTWTQPNGGAAYDVQILSTGETMTIAEATDITAPPGTTQRGRMTRMFHWGPSNVRPTNAPKPPVMQASMETVIAPASPCCTPGSSMVSSNRLTPMTTPTEETTIVEEADGPTTRPGLMARMRGIFHKHDDAMMTADSSLIPPDQTAPMTSSASHMIDMPEATTVSASVTAAPPANVGDARQSWGKADDHSTPQIVNLPHADTTRPDPFQNLQGYTKIPTVNKNADKEKTGFLGLRKSSATEAVAPGTASIAAAGQGPYGPLGYVPVPVMTPPPVTHPPAPATPPASTTAASQTTANNAFTPNAFTTWVPSQAQAKSAPPPVGGNAFTQPMQQQPTQQPSSPYGYRPLMPAMPMNGYGLPASPPQPVTMFMATPNRAAVGASAAPQTQVVMASPTAPVQLPSTSDIRQASMVVPTTSSMPEQDQVLLVMMRDALYPSQREGAAEKLAASRPSDAQVIAAILDRVRNDEAVSVRTCCIHCLVTMRADTPEVKQALKELKQDSEPAVSHAAGEALAEFNIR